MTIAGVATIAVALALWFVRGERHRNYEHLDWDQCLEERIRLCGELETISTSRQQASTNEERHRLTIRKAQADYKLTRLDRRRDSFEVSM